MSGEKITARVIYRVVNSEQSYNIGNAIIVVEYMPRVNYIVNEMTGF